jgi:hypothetical protein
MSKTRDQLHSMELSGTLIYEGNEGLMIRTSDNAFWDAIFEVIGPTRTGSDNDENPCTFRIKNFGQVEVLIDGVSRRLDDEIEIRFWGPWEYKASLDWFEAIGLKAGEIKRRESSS